jgi:Low affinity iron permease
MAVPSSGGGHHRFCSSQGHCNRRLPVFDSGRGGAFFAVNLRQLEPALTDARWPSCNFDHQLVVWLQHWFSRFAAATANWTGSTSALVTAVMVVALWSLTGPFFSYNDSWQLVIMTIMTFLMIFDNRGQCLFGRSSCHRRRLRPVRRPYEACQLVCRPDKFTEAAGFGFSI